MLATDGRLMARTVRRLPVGSGADTALLRESIGTPWDPILGTAILGSNISTPVPEVSRREVVPLAQEEEPPIVKMHGEQHTEEQEQERAKHLPAEASASSSGPSASGYNVDVPMTDVFEASLRDMHARRSCDSKGGRLCCEQSAD